MLNLLWSGEKKYKRIVDIKYLLPSSLLLTDKKIYKTGFRFYLSSCQSIVIDIARLNRNHIVCHCFPLSKSDYFHYANIYIHLFLAENRTPWSVGFREMYHRTWWWNRECLSYRYILFFAFLIGMVYTVLEMNIWIYWSESNSWNLFYILYIWIKTEKFTVANKVLLVLECRTGAHHEDWRGEQSFTGLGMQDQCSSWGLKRRTKFYWSWAGGLVFIVKTVYIILYLILLLIRLLLEVMFINLTITSLYDLCSLLTT